MTNEREALKLALDWFCCYLDKSMSRNNQETLAEEAITAIKEALAQPEQEPVIVGRWPSAAIGKETLQDALKRENGAPLQRTWVGLTDDEIQECFKITPDQHLPWHIYQRIEAKLKEKNT